jgi:hypothetical protein
MLSSFFGSSSSSSKTKRSNNNGRTKKAKGKNPAKHAALDLLDVMHDKSSSKYNEVYSDAFAVYEDRDKYTKEKDVRNPFFIAILNAYLPALEDMIKEKDGGKINEQYAEPAKKASLTAYEGVKAAYAKLPPTGEGQDHRNVKRLREQFTDVKVDIVKFYDKFKGKAANKGNELGEYMEHLKARSYVEKLQEKSKKGNVERLERRFANLKSKGGSRRGTRRRCRASR